MKRLVSLFVALCLAAAVGSPALAEDTKAIPGRLVKFDVPGGHLVFKLMDDAGKGKKEAWILGDTLHPEGDIVIPPEIEGYPVTRLYVDELDWFVEREDGTLTQENHSPGAVFRTDGFTWSKGLTSLTFPETMTNFEKMRDGDLYAFDGCTALRSVTFPEGVEELNGGFSGIPLETVTLPSSIRWLSEDEFAGAVPGLVIRAPKGSYAEDYAERMGYTFEPVERVPAFRDLGGHWAREDIEQACRDGLVRGVSATRFDPDAPATRGMFVTVLHRWAAPEQEEPPYGFADVDSGMASYFEAVNWAAHQGIVVGNEEGLFRPGAYVTREQAAVMLYRYAEKCEGRDMTATNAAEGFPDSGRVSPFAWKAVCWCIDHGLMKGGTSGRLAPLEPVTRAEMVVLLGRYSGMDAFWPVPE